MKLWVMQCARVVFLLPSERAQEGRAVHRHLIQLLPRPCLLPLLLVDFVISSAQAPGILPFDLCVQLTV